MHWGRKWLVDFNADKTQLIFSDQSNNTGPIAVKTDELRKRMRKNHLLRSLGLLFLLNWIRALILTLLLKGPP